MRVIDCTIREMSDSGARLLIANTVGVPETFHLFEKSSGMVYPTSVAWRQASAIGSSSTGRRRAFTTAPTERFLFA